MGDFVISEGHATLKAPRLGDTSYDVRRDSRDGMVVLVLGTLKGYGVSGAWGCKLKDLSSGGALSSEPA
jgi:hypothetical protein